MRNRVILWIRKHIARSTNIAFVVLVGSFVRYSINYRDVDVILVVKTKNIKIFLAKLSRDFYLTFKIRLHLTLFHISRVASIRVGFVCADKLRWRRSWV